MADVYNTTAFSPQAIPGFSVAVAVAAGDAQS
jgi:hypothetical protein